MVRVFDKECIYRNESLWNIIKLGIYQSSDFLQPEIIFILLSSTYMSNLKTNSARLAKLDHIKHVCSNVMMTIDVCTCVIMRAFEKLIRLTLNI